MSQNKMDYQQKKVNLTGGHFNVCRITTNFEDEDLGAYARTIFDLWAKEQDLPLEETALGIVLFDEIINIIGTKDSKVKITSDYSTIIVHFDSILSYPKKIYFWKEGKLMDLFDHIELYETRY